MADVTIRDVARRANVSIATVSRVLNHEQSVRPKTVEKVNDAIKEIQYVPNSLARNLKSDTSKMVALLVSDITNNHFTLMAKVIETILREQGYSVIVCNTDQDPQQELDYLHRMVGLRVDGIILNTTACNNEYITELSHSVPTVLIERSIEDPAFCGDFIGSNNFAGVKVLTQHLIDCGHRKIGFIGASNSVNTGRERLEGFATAMKSIGVNIGEDYPYKYISEYFSLDGGVLGCRYLMSLEDRPTSLVVVNNTIALGVYKYLRANRFSIPGDVSVVSYGEIENSELFYVEPCHVTLNPYFIGEKAAKYLLTRIHEPTVRNREVIFEPSLVTSESVGRI